MVELKKLKGREEAKTNSDLHKGLENRSGLVNGCGLINGNGMFNNRGRTNGRGLVNGRGRTIGLTNGLINGNALINCDSKVNGLGETNRSGIVNEMGLINGNGLVNGQGRSKGRGLVNGLGLVNGNGLINGRGIVNANGFTNGLRLRRNRFGVVTNRDLKTGLAILIVFLMIIPSSIFFLSSLIPTSEPTPEKIIIDGEFDDWNSINKYSENLIGVPANINILNYALDWSKDKLSIYIRMQENLFSSENPHMVEIFIDADGAKTSGYEISSDFGSDYRMELYGWNDSIEKASLFEFTGIDRLNFNSWRAIGGMQFAIRSTELEVKIDTGALVKFEEDFRIQIKTKDNEGREASSTVSPSMTYGALLVTQKSILQNSVASGKQIVAQIMFTAKGSDVNVTKVTLSANRGILDDIDPFKVLAGKTVTRNVILDVAGLEAGSFIKANLISVEADRSVKMSGGETRLYVDSYPSNIVIDGLFEEWQTNISTDYDSWIYNQNLDISRYSTARTGFNAYFYMETSGMMLGGTSIPWMIFKPLFGEVVESEESEVEKPELINIPRISGEDIARIYVDSNNSDSRGFPIGDVLADHMIEVNGIYGTITSRKFYKWLDRSWTLVSEGSVKAEIDDSRMESSISLDMFDSLDDPEVVFVTTDWSGMKDITPTHEGLKGQKLEDTKDSGGPDICAPTWPERWVTITTDSGLDEASADQSLNILELYKNSEDATYLFIRIRTNQKSGEPTITNNSWGVYINTDGIPGNDYIIQENGTMGYSFWIWNGVDWDWDGTWWESNVVRTGMMEVEGTNYGIVDIAIRRMFVAGLDDGDTIQGFAHDTELFDRSFDTVRDPTDISPDPNNDVTIPTTIPEFQELFIPVCTMIALPIFIYRYRKKKE